MISVWEQGNSGRCCNRCYRSPVGADQCGDDDRSTGPVGGVRTGALWQSLPARYGRVADRVWALASLAAHWCLVGVSSSILTALQTRADTAGLVAWDVSVGCTIDRPRSAWGAPTGSRVQKEPQGGHLSGPNGHGLGRSRGQGRPVEGGRQTLLARQPRLPAPARDPLHHPGAFDRVVHRRRRAYLASRLRPSTPRTTSPAHGRVRHPPAEGTPGGAPRFGKLAVRFQATVFVAAINEWLRPLPRGRQKTAAPAVPRNFRRVGDGRFPPVRHPRAGRTCSARCSVAPLIFTSSVEAGSVRRELGCVCTIPSSTRPCWLA